MVFELFFYCVTVQTKNTFAINSWEDMSLGSLYNVAIAKKRNSALLNALTALGE